MLSARIERENWPGMDQSYISKQLPIFRESQRDSF